MTKKISAIWAEDNKGLIGKEGRLPWHLPKDLAHFKAITSGQAILMGRVTFEGLGGRPLPNRTNLILSRDKTFQAQGVQILHSVEEVLEWFDKQDKNLYIAGGSEIYRLFEPYYDRLIVTKVDGEFDGDTYFPKLDLTTFEQVSDVFYEKDEKNAYDFHVVVLERNKE
ncbi:dihydrofolate reductase [Streptococcus sp. sy018]|uniref:dihydrofolate reductase n=1 Tax=Streptococcus sp. sy018 TaxID=2600147 RepID=UPI0011B39713|nr:dihydrofolate reductase [Streptococcus sp. sy018]TWS95547.1 dihydrofolate reductase [Streptococcus sp. sy018]